MAGMGVIAKLFLDVGEVALGLTPFSWLLWSYVTVLLLVVGPVFTHVAPQVVDPPARLLATDPVRVVIWMPLSILGTIACTILLIITIFGAMLLPVAAILVAMAGYLALARLLGEAIGRRVGVAAVPAFAASFIGIVAMRIVSAVPIVGTAAHSLLVWIGFAAASCISVRAGVQWYRRRLPDEVQFRGETLVEWYPDGDPADGRPSTGTGRPVLGNVRGNEDRAPRLDDAADGDET
ncbi:MAG: hypothetical protein JWM86_2707 [Thermoleophilia bacterium]|nr:hypothetical protein [Thermoleophilia bacterium]